jgi:hypothetical protein
MTPDIQFQPLEFQPTALFGPGGRYEPRALEDYPAHFPRFARVETPEPYSRSETPRTLTPIQTPRPRTPRTPRTPMTEDENFGDGKKRKTKGKKRKDKKD